MAGEVKGRIYEAITKVALELAIKGNRKGLKVLWHEQPDWISIEADLALGKSVNDIENLFMVTHSTLEGNSHKKFWRNEGEHFQWKVQGEKPIKCYDITFEASVKPALKKISDCIMDGTLMIPEQKYGKQLITFVSTKKKDFGSSDVSRYEHTKSLVDPKSAKYDKIFCELIKDYSKDLKKLTTKENKNLNSLWKILRKFNTSLSVIPSIKNTYVRNGIAKLILFDPSFRTLAYDSISKNDYLDVTDIPQYIFDLKLVEEDIVGYKIDDNYITDVINLLGKETCEYLILSIPSRMNDFLVALRAVGNLKIYTQFVIEHYNELIAPAGMKKWLIACYNDPSGIIPRKKKLYINPIDTWLFVYCMTLEKALKNKVLAYGISNLAADTGFPEIGKGGFIIPPFIHREKMPSDEILNAIAKVFSKKVKKIGNGKLESVEFITSMKKMLLQRQMYILNVYRYFDPIGDLIKKLLAENDIDFKQISMKMGSI